MRLNPNTVLSAYDTSVLIGQRDKAVKIADDIKRIALINKDSDLIKVFGTSANIIGLVGETSHVPTFLHPIIHDGVAYIDLRPYMNKQGNIRNIYEYSLMLRRAMVDLTWAKDPSRFLGQEAFIIDLFSSWFSYGLHRSTDVGLITSNQYRILAAIYYMSFFSTEHYAKDHDLIVMLLKRIPQITSVPTQIVDDLLSYLGDEVVTLYRHGTPSQRVAPFELYSQFSKVLTDITDGSVKIDRGVIHNAITRGAFIGANSMEIAAIGLEHPATFVTIMSTAVEQGIKNNTALGKAAAGIRRKYNLDHFNRFMTEIRLLYGID